MMKQETKSLNMNMHDPLGLLEDKTKVITDKSIDDKMEALGFGYKQQNCEILSRESVLNHFKVVFTSSMDFHADVDYYMYEETTADGYSVFITTNDMNNISINDDVHYYDSQLSTSLVEAVVNGSYKLSEESNLYFNAATSSLIYLEDCSQEFVSEAIAELFEYAKQDLMQDVKSSLLEDHIAKVEKYLSNKNM